MESESPSPNLGLIGKELTERAGTDVIAKFLGHEMRLSSPIWFPEGWKNKIVDEMRGKFQRAFPGIDFYRVSNSELRNIGVQTVFAESHEEPKNTDSKSKHETTGLALIESMTQIVATYAYLYGKGKPVHLDDLRRSGFHYANSPNIDLITKKLIRAVEYHHMLQYKIDVDQITHEVAQTIAHALFTGKFNELKNIWGEKPQDMPFDELLCLPMRSQRNHTDISLDAAKTEIQWNTIGMYTEYKSEPHKNAIVYSAIGSSVPSFWRPITDVLARIGPKRLKIKNAPEQDWLRYKDAMRAYSLFTKTINLHEFAHFFSFRMWRKQPLEALDPSLRVFLT